MIYLWLILTVVAGDVIGTVITSARTAHTIAKMSDDELKTLASRVRQLKGVSQ